MRQIHAELTITPVEVERRAATGATSPRALAAIAWARFRDACAELDDVTMAIWRDVLESLAERAPDDGEVATQLALARAWSSLCAGALAPDVALPRSSEEPWSAGLRVVALARARRRAGRPHLASRTLARRAALAPDELRDWIAWEAMFASGAPHEGPRGGAAESLARLLGAIERGDRAAAASALARCRERVRGCPVLAGDLEALAGTVDLATFAPASDVAAFRAGQRARVPNEIGGLARAPDGAPGSARAWVVVEPDAPGYRVIDRARPLFPEHPRVARVPGRLGRVETLIASLALAGPRGETSAALFEAVYGDDFDPRRHQSVLDVLVFRARARLEGLAAIERLDGVVRLDTLRPFLVDDPRCGDSLEDALLEAIARDGRAWVAAPVLARALGLPLRNVRRAMRALIGSGALRRSRSGAPRVEWGDEGDSERWLEE